MLPQLMLSALVLLVLPAAAQTTWLVNNLTNIGGHAVTVLSQPRIIRTLHGNAIQFNGINDGLIVSNNLLVGLTNFTVGLLFQPAYFEGAVLALCFTGRLLEKNEIVPDPARYDFSRSAATH